MKKIILWNKAQYSCIFAFHSLRPRGDPPKVGAQPLFHHSCADLPRY
jgi:hypothetical protein